MWQILLLAGIEHPHFQTEKITHLKVKLGRIALCLGTYGDPRGEGVSYEQGTPVSENQCRSHSHHNPHADQLAEARKQCLH